MGKRFELTWVQFRFLFGDDWMSPHEDQQENREAMTALCQYSEPFNCECRAFGRLQESGNEDLAIKCFGYLLLDEEHERTVRQFWKASNRFDIEFNGSIFACGDTELRSFFQGKSGRPAPIRGIVKEFGQCNEVLQTKKARRILRDTTRFQQLGIFSLDTGTRQMVNDKWADLSQALTVPHFLTNPELNPRLTPEMVADMELETFIFSKHDYLNFDDMILSWNFEAKNRKRKLSIRALPSRLRYRDTYDLRSLPSRGRVYSYVDPRRYDWKASAAHAENRAMGEVDGRGSGRKAKGSNRGKPTGVIRKTRRWVDDHPPRWYFVGNCEKAAKQTTTAGFCTNLDWDFKDGLIFPRKRSGPEYSS